MIFLFILGEIITVPASIIMAAKGSVDLMIKLCDAGYKVDEEAFNKYNKQLEMKKSELRKKLEKASGIIIFLTPGINVLRVKFVFHNTLNRVLKSEEAKEVLIPMTEEEKTKYSKLKTKMEKLAFASVATVGKKDEEFIGIVGKRPVIVDHGLTSIYNEKLLPLAYTFDEVKKLNDATGYSYRIGKVDGVNTAIVGIPNSESPVHRLQFKDENYKQTHDFEKMSEEEAQDKTFVVYPFSKEKEILACVEEIRKNRRNKVRPTVTTETPLEFDAQLEELLERTLIAEERNANAEKSPVLAKVLDQVDRK